MTGVDKMTARLAVLICATFALPAFAQDTALQTPAQVCATQDDLVDGIVVQYASGGTDSFVRDVQDPAVAVLTAELGGERMGLVRKAHGYIDLSVLGPHGESVVYDYGVLPADMPKPASGTAWEVVATVTTPQGAATERQLYTFGEEGTLTIRDCTWDIVEVVMQFSGHEQAFYWFPQMGISTPVGEDVLEITPLALAP